MLAMCHVCAILVANTTEIYAGGLIAALRVMLTEYEAVEKETTYDVNND
jgi:hypothetical protein